MKLQGRAIDKKGARVYFLRHCESIANSGIARVDTPLSELGVEQAKAITGLNYDVVLCSPMRRCCETLCKSGITYNRLVILQSARERVFDTESDRLIFEPAWEESGQEFFRRIERFHTELEEFCRSYKTVLIVGHSYFFNCWFRQGCYPPLLNGQLVELVDREVE
jgi:broad specificity phosphatase PhoE